MPSFASLGKFFGKTVSEGASFAAGVAVAPTLTPVVEDVRQQAWAKAPVRRVDAETAAAIVAEDVELTAWGTSEALHEGLSPDRFAALLGEALNAPGLGTLFTAWRRGEITDADFTHGLRKAKLETRWDAPLKALKDERMAPAQIALAVVRSLLDSHHLLVGENDTTGGVIKPTPVSPIDPLTEALASGIDTERLRVLINSIGLPMSLQSAASAVFRGIIEKPDFYLAVAQGDTRPAWADAIFDQARQIPSVADYVNARIRGWISDTQMYEGTARHGMSQEDTHLLYLRTGRPAAPGQMATAAARGIDGPDNVPMDEKQFLDGIAQSDIRPEWGPMLWESRFLYPPLFQITRLVQAGAITPDTAADWATKDRYPPEVVSALSAYWKQPASSTSKAETATDLLALYDAGIATDAQTVTALEGLGYPKVEAEGKIKAHDARLVVTERTRVVTAAHKAFIDGSIQPQEVQTLLGELGIPADIGSRMLAVWVTQKLYGV